MKPLFYLFPYFDYHFIYIRYIKKALVLFLVTFTFLQGYAQSNFYLVPVITQDCNNNILPEVSVWLNQVPTPENKSYYPGLCNYYAISDSNGLAVFDSVFGALYNLRAFKHGYDSLKIDHIYIQSSDTITINLIPTAYPPRSFKVNPLTSVATWIKPRKEIFPFEDFEGSQFPSPGWQIFNGSGGGCSWFVTDDASLDIFPVPPGDGYYAFASSYWCGSGPYCNSYLITPSFDLRELDSAQLSYRSYYTGEDGVTATVEYSTDSGITWHVIDTTPIVTKWMYNTIDLTPYHGTNGDSVFYLAFHANDHIVWSSTWGIDNISVDEGVANVLGYYIFLDNQLIDELPPDCTRYYYNNLTYGQTYLGEISAIYSCNVSERKSYSWTSSFLYPPQNFGTQYTTNADEVFVYWNPPAFVETDSNTNLLLFNIYIDNDIFKQVPYEGQGVNEQMSTILDSVAIGQHTFKASALYELSEYGFPGDTGESMFTSIDTQNIVYGFHIPFYEAWDNPDFEFNKWSINSSRERARWVINEYDGNPPASAALQKDTVGAYYNTYLISYPINATDITDGDIYIEFDVKADVDSGSFSNFETLKMDVLSNNSWVNYFQLVGTYPTDFEKYVIDITDNAKGCAFQYRFQAAGNPINLKSKWIIDNIKVYRTCSAPQDLVGTYLWDSDSIGNDSYGALISWKAEGFVSLLSSHNKLSKDKIYRNMQYFNIYRKSNNQNEYVLYNNIPFDTAVTDYWFYDKYPDVQMGEGYFYQVTAVWEDENVCESPPAHALEIPSDDFVYIYITGTDKKKTDNSSLILFPNPTKDKITINSNYFVNELSVFSLSGKMVLCKKFHNKTACTLNISKLDAGMYMAIINTSKGVFLKRFVVFQ